MGHGRSVCTENAAKILIFEGWCRRESYSFLSYLLLGNCAQNSGNCFVCHMLAWPGLSLFLEGSLLKTSS